jgi:hypothetical protein
VPEPLVSRDPLIAAITTFLAGQEARTLDAIRDALERELDPPGGGQMSSNVTSRATARLLRVVL